MERLLRGLLFCLLGLGLMTTEAFEVQVKDGSNTTCTHASMSVNFTIRYETESGTNRSVTFSAPDEVTTIGSTCGTSDDAALLVVNFVNNHSWSVNFTRNSTMYSIDMIVFTYNTNDSTLFPDAKRKGLLTTVKSVNDPIPINATYTCLQQKDVITDNVVQVYWNVSLLAYAQGVTIKREFHCSEDAPTTHAPTTHIVTTTTPKPTPKPEDKPSIGNYFVISSKGKCLMATMGLQLNASVFVSGHNVWTTRNINPNSTISSGSCSNESALLRLNDSDTILEFSFSLRQKNFYLHEVNVTFANGSGISHISNNNLSFWEASVGKSYLCHKEQMIVVSEDLSINTFEVRVQPFDVNNATYGAAEDCFADQNFTVPIVVGAALGVLVVLVMVAYFIGLRNRRSAGYQHF
ncbi:lysosome-associated membrane glycoprotein 2 isoform 3-T3 [Anomaloglossus baeobatrachus]|uniref:lysosome-associated membrane glycoprotein 2 isoform X3 n=1 Tax=Anomaloglossus baeobatrachus TaxID=238106 RepID=UPI003F5075E9